MSDLNEPTPPESWCAHCKITVVPLPKGLCPTCGRFVPGSRKRQVNVERRQQLLAKLVADYQPQTTLAHSSCEHLAGVLEQLDVLKAGTQEHKRLVELSQLLGSALERSRTSTKDPHADVDDMTAEQLEAEALRLVVLARALRTPSTTSISPPFDTTPIVSSLPGDGHAAAVPREAPAPAPEPPTCKWCNRSPCIGPAHPAFATFHHDDPTEVERRDKEATAEMHESLRRYGPARY
jgi:hypothetical protein